MASLFDIFDSGSGQAAAQDAFSAQKQGLNRGFGQAQQYGGKSIDALKGGQKKAIGALNQGNRYYQQALAPNQTMFDQGTEGVDYYGQLVGLGGGDPGQMQETLQNIPGYQFAQEQGIDALNRTANSRGMLASGNNSQDIMRFSQGLADQNYFNYLDALNPYFGQQQSGASGLTNTYGNMANNQANKANVYTGTAGNVANVQSGLGNLAYNTRVGIGQAGAQLSQDQYQAEQGASQNMWNAILGVGGMLTGGVSNYVGAGGKF